MFHIIGKLGVDLFLAQVVSLFHQERGEFKIDWTNRENY